MDWRFVCFSFFPLKSKLGKGFTKRIQRDALKSILQDDIRLRRDKIGWNSPSHEWFNTFLKDELLTLFKDNNSESLMIQKYKAEKSFDKFLNLKKPNFNDGYRVWLKIQPYLWRKSLDSKVWK